MFFFVYLCVFRKRKRKREEERGVRNAFQTFPTTPSLLGLPTSFNLLLLRYNNKRPVTQREIPPSLFCFSPNQQALSPSLEVSGSPPKFPLLRAGRLRQGLDPDRDQDAPLPETVYHRQLWGSCCLTWLHNCEETPRLVQRGPDGAPAEEGDVCVC